MSEENRENTGEITNVMIGETLKKIRREKGLTQKQTAKALSVSQSFISAVEQGKRTARMDFVIKLIKFYGVSYECVFGKTGNAYIECEPQKSTEEPLHLFLQETGVEDSADIFLDLCRYVMIRTLYGLNPYNSDRIFSLPKETAVKLALEQISGFCENLYDYLKKSPEKCKKLEVPTDFNQYLYDLISRCENLLK